MPQKLGVNNLNRFKISILISDLCKEIVRIHECYPFLIPLFLLVYAYKLFTFFSTR